MQSVRMAYTSDDTPMFTPVSAADTAPGYQPCGSAVTGSTTLAAGGYHAGSTIRRKQKQHYCYKTTLILGRAVRGAQVNRGGAEQEKANQAARALSFGDLSANAFGVELRQVSAKQFGAEISATSTAGLARSPRWQGSSTNTGDVFI
uniref:Uncharacterized protein n=1 Tax=Oryza brachyantha TaxID=4533 RepID=J3LXX1_ORYBR